jgi:hypothetical protein
MRKFKFYAKEPLWLATVLGARMFIFTKYLPVTDTRLNEKRESNLFKSSGDAEV